MERQIDQLNDFLSVDERQRRSHAPMKGGASPVTPLVMSNEQHRTSSGSSSRPTSAGKSRPSNNVPPLPAQEAYHRVSGGSMGLQSKASIGALKRGR